MHDVGSVDCSANPLSCLKLNDYCAHFCVRAYFNFYTKYLYMKNETRDTTIEGRSIEVYTILNGYENIYFKIIFFTLKASKRTRGHDFTLVKERSRMYVTA